MRLDKFLCEAGIGTRSQVKDIIRQRQITVNGSIVMKADMKIAESEDIICFRGQPVSYRKFFYYMLNKPADVVSATRDNTAETVIELLRKEDRREDLFPVGRLDKDTVGLLLLTNDGELAHRLLSPKKHVDKTYLVTLEQPLSESARQKLEQGVNIGEERPTLPARAEITAEKELLLTIHEGKFHQVKRMLHAVDNRVTALKRVTFGGLTLDEGLRPGEYRELTEKEVKLLYDA